MRISCASFVRIQSSDGRLALLVNKNQRKQGRTVLVPIGGALEVPIALGHKIMAQLNLTEADFDKPLTTVVDLRFTVADDLVGQVRRLFLSWDSGPERELREELVDETGILTAADLDADGFALTFAGVGEETAVSSRSGKAAGQTTLRLVSVYELSYGQRVAERLQAAAGEIDSPLYFVTPAEIEGGYTSPGVEIAPISKTLLAPSLALDS